MFTKSLFAAAALATTLAAGLPAPAANAGVHVSVGLGVPVYVPPVYAPPPVYVGGGYGGYDGGYDDGNDGGYDGGYGGGYDGGYDGGYGGYNHHRRPQAYLSCGEGRRLLWRYGYNGIRVADCQGRVYSYTAWRNGRHYLVRVSAWGNIGSVRRIY